MAPVHSFREFLRTLINRGRQKDESGQMVNNGTENSASSKSLSRKRVEAANAKAKKGVILGEGKSQRSFSLSIVGIANSVELFKGEVGKGGSMQATR